MKRRSLLILNWRDPWHPKSGGAELMTLRLAQYLVSTGAWDVEWFSAAYQGAKDAETIDGIRYVRAGSQYTVHVQAYRRYRGSQQFHVAVEEINTIPFYASRYLQCPVFVLMYQLAREVWLFEAPPVLRQIGYALEPFYLRPLFRSRVMTISPSSAQTLRNIGFRGAIDIVPIAVDEIAVASVPPKFQPPEIVVLSRLAPSKRIDHAIEAAGLLARRGWKGTLRVVGRGDEEYVARLRRLAMSTGAPVEFEGRVSDARRASLLDRASLLWMTSLREGWGLVVTEAARHATPAVVYDVPGLRDAVTHGVTGFVVAERPEVLAQATLDLLAAQTWPSFAQRALDASLQYSWDASGRCFESILSAALAPRAA